MVPSKGPTFTLFVLHRFTRGTFGIKSLLESENPYLCVISYQVMPRYLLGERGRWSLIDVPIRENTGTEKVNKKVIPTSYFSMTQTLEQIKY